MVFFLSIFSPFRFWDDLLVLLLLLLLLRLRRRARSPERTRETERERERENSIFRNFSSFPGEEIKNEERLF